MAIEAPPGSLRVNDLRTPSAVVTARLTRPFHSSRILRSRTASSVRKSPFSGASMNPTFTPSASAISAKRFSKTVLPTPRSPTSMQLLPDLPVNVRRRVTPKPSINSSRPINAGGRVPAPLSSRLPSPRRDAAAPAGAVRCHSAAREPARSDSADSGPTGSSAAARSSTGPRRGATTGPSRPCTPDGSKGVDPDGIANVLRDARILQLTASERLRWRARSHRR